MIAGLCAIWCRATRETLLLLADAFHPGDEEEGEMVMLADAVSVTEVPEDVEEYTAHGPTAIGFRR